LQHAKTSRNTNRNTSDGSDASKTLTGTSGEFGKDVVAVHLVGNRPKLEVEKQDNNHDSELLRSELAT
jgi:hypothetical protein